jgi:hypothetical protein
MYCTVLYCTALHCTALHCNVMYRPLLCCCVVYCTVLHCAVLTQSAQPLPPRETTQSTQCCNSLYAFRRVCHGACHAVAGAVQAVPLSVRVRDRLEAPHGDGEEEDRTAPSPPRHTQQDSIREPSQTGEIYMIRSDWIGVDKIELDWIGLDWIGLDWIGLDWIGSILHCMSPSLISRPPVWYGCLPSCLMPLWYCIS